jgi:hypothetical protein
VNPAEALESLRVHVRAAEALARESRIPELAERLSLLFGEVESAWSKWVNPACVDIGHGFLWYREGRLRLETFKGGHRQDVPIASASLTARIAAVDQLALLETRLKARVGGGL